MDSRLLSNGVTITHNGVCETLSWKKYLEWEYAGKQYKGDISFDYNWGCAIDLDVGSIHDLEKDYPDFDVDEFVMILDEETSTY